MKPTNKKVEALALKYTPWAIAIYTYDQELYIPSEIFLDTEVPRYTLMLRTFSTRHEAQGFLANMVQEAGLKYKIVKLAVVL